MTTVVEETELLRGRVRRGANAMRGEWTVEQLRALATLLESMVPERQCVDTVGNVAWLADRRIDG